MRKKNKSNASGGIVFKKMKMNEHSHFLSQRVMSLMSCTMKYMVSHSASPEIINFHKNQFKQVTDTVFFGNDLDNHVISELNIDEIKQANLTIGDFPYKKVGVILQLQEDDMEDFDDLANIELGDKITYRVYRYAALMSITKDCVNLKVVKGNIQDNWFYDAYYYRLPLNFIDEYLNGTMSNLELRLSYEKQEMPSDEYLLKHCSRFIKVILSTIARLKMSGNAGCIAKYTTRITNQEEYPFYLWQEE